MEDTILNNRPSQPSFNSVITALRTLLLTLAITCLAQGSIARAEPVAAAFRAAILLRSLGYERGIAAGEGELVLLVVSGADAASQADSKDMTAAFQALAARMKIGKRTVVVRTLTLRKGKDIAAPIRALLPSAVYLSRGLESLSTELAAGADVAHWVPMCADGAALGAGCAIGVRAMPDSSQLVIDLKRAQKASLSFDPRMLRLAHVLQ